MYGYSYGITTYGGSATGASLTQLLTSSVIFSESRSAEQAIHLTE